MLFCLKFSLDLSFPTIVFFLDESIFFSLTAEETLKVTAEKKKKKSLGEKEMLYAII